uniref:hypothetical protein n=1 Tax=Polaribacter sp. TaxID=1920175 RepID=UPI0040472969
MRVKHKNAEKNNSNPSMSLSHWQKEYYQNKKYLNYEFYDVKEIYDLYSIDQTNGNLTYVTSDFAHAIFPKVRENPTKFVYKEHDPKYLDEHLMPRNISYSGLSFFERVRKIWNNIPKLKTIYESIINSTISKVTSNIVTGVIIGILILIIWALFGTEIVEYLKTLKK